MLFGLDSIIEVAAVALVLWRLSGVRDCSKQGAAGVWLDWSPSHPTCLRGNLRQRCAPCTARHPRVNHARPHHQRCQFLRYALAFSYKVLSREEAAIAVSCFRCQVLLDVLLAQLVLASGLNRLSVATSRMVG